MAAFDWNDDPPRPAAGKPPQPNREAVWVIVCPTCKSRRVERHSVVGLVSHWFCKADTTCPRWKEAASDGERGKATLA